MKGMSLFFHWVVLTICLYPTIVTSRPDHDWSCANQLDSKIGLYGLCDRSELPQSNELYSTPFSVLIISPHLHMKLSYQSIGVVRRTEDGGLDADYESI